MYFFKAQLCSIITVLMALAVWRSGPKGQSPNRQHSLADHPSAQNECAGELRDLRQNFETYGTFILNLAKWCWFGTITLRTTRFGRDGAFAELQRWLHQLQEAAGGNIAWACAENRGQDTRRTHFHLLLAGVDHLNIDRWEDKAHYRFGSCQFDYFDPEKGGAFYLAQNALSEHGDLHCGGKLLDRDAKPPERIG